MVTPDLAKTYAVAEFMLNLLDITDAPTRQEVEAYLQAHFASSKGGYQIPVHQDFLQIRAQRPLASPKCNALSSEQETGNSDFTRRSEKASGTVSRTWRVRRTPRRPSPSPHTLPTPMDTAAVTANRILRRYWHRSPLLIVSICMMARGSYLCHLN